MSAIAGYVAFDGAGEEHGEEVLRSMLARMKGRSPDGYRCEVQGGGAIGYGAFHITSEEGRGSQPVVRSSQILTADVRLDNRNDIARTIGISDTLYSDGHLLGMAFDRWGQDFARHLIGDYAIAIWDASKRHLVLTRDPFGIRPLFYTRTPAGGIAFASEIKGLLVVPGVAARLNEQRLASYLVELWEDEDLTETIYEGIFRVPRGHVLTANSTGVRAERYHELEPEVGMERWSFEDYVEGFRERFDEAVRCRLRSRGPIGSQLSGGLDSSAVTAVARDVLATQSQGLFTYSLVFEKGSPSDERPYIESVLDQGGLTPRLLRGDATGHFNNLDPLYDILDDNVVGGNQHTIWRMFEAAREDGVRVLLDGFDGDTTVGHGYRYFYELATAGQWDQFGAEARALAKRYRGAQQLHEFQTPARSVDGLFRVYGYPHLDDLARKRHFGQLAMTISKVHHALGARRYRLMRNLIGPLLEGQLDEPEGGADYNRTACDFLDPAFVRRTNLRERIQAAPALGVLRPERDNQRASFLNPSIELGLSGLNQIGARFGLEPRHPFMDVRLINYVLALPPTLSLHNGWTRYVLRQAVSHRLPRDVAWRIGKADMSANTGHALMSQDRESYRGGRSRTRGARPVSR